MTSREQILGAARAALHRREGEPAPPAPAVLLSEGPQQGLVEQFKNALEALAGKVVLVNSHEEAAAAVNRALNGRTFIRSTDPYSRDGIAATEVGITSADYALADTGSLVFFSESGESRLLSLLPPCHIAVIESSKIVPSLDDVFRRRPLPGDESSAMVMKRHHTSHENTFGHCCIGFFWSCVCPVRRILV